MQKAVVNQFKIGSLIEILETDNVTKRFPKLIGDRGTVEATPNHPGIWFTIVVNSTGESIKIQQNAIKLISNPKESGLKTPLRPQKPVVAEQVEPEEDSKTANRPRSNSSPGSTHHSIAFALKCGMKVAIIGTENVVQRVPQLVDQIGVIKEAPVHPATWFKVEFPDHKIITFRPSALRPVDEEGNPIIVSFQQRLTSPVVTTKSPPIKNERKPSIDRTINSSAKTDIVATAPPLPPAKSSGSSSRGKKSALTLLSATDPDGWVGRRVQIVGGRHNELQGIVRSSGNGWVQIDTDQGEVAKRSYELEIIASRGGSSIAAAESSEEGADEDDAGSDGLETVNNPRMTSRNKKFKTLRVAPPRQSRTSAVTENGMKNSSEEVVVGTRTRNASTSSSGSNNVSKSVFIEQVAGRGNNTTSETGSSSSSNGRSQRARAYSDPLALSPTAGNSRNHRNGGGFSFHNMMTTSNSSSHRGTASDLFGNALHGVLHHDKPIKSSFLIESKRNFIVKYVTKHQEKIGHRPDLVDWKYRIDATLHANCYEYEMQAARLFDETHCKMCNLEKWPSAKFCWNENCPISPVYFKLTGEPAPSKRAVVSVDRPMESSHSEPSNMLTAQALKKRSLVVTTTTQPVIPEGSDAGDRETVSLFDEGAVTAVTLDSSEIVSSNKRRKTSNDELIGESLLSSLQCFGAGSSPNPVTSYLLELPARLLSQERDPQMPFGGGQYEYRSASSNELSTFKPRSDSYASTDCEASHGSSPVSLVGGGDHMNYVR